MNKNHFAYFKKAISIVLIEALVFGQAASVWPSEVKEVPTSSARFLDNLDPSVAQVEALFIDRESVETDPFVIYIQDAHADPAAQQNIRQTLHYIYRQTKGAQLAIGLEGALGPIHPEYLKFFKDYPEADQKIREDLAEKGELTGAELFAWDLYEKGNSSNLALEGIENPDLYRANAAAYRALANQSQIIKRVIQSFRDETGQAASKIFNPQLRKFLVEKDRRKIGRYSDETAAFGQKNGRTPQFYAYLTYLSEKAKEVLEIDLSDVIEQLRFPNLVRIQAIEQMGKEFDTTQAVKEWEAIQASLKKDIDQEAFELLKSTVFRKPINRSSSSIRALYEELASKESNALQLINAKINLSKFLSVEALRSEINALALMSEAESLEREIEAKLAKEEGEKKLLVAMNDLGLLEKLFYLELTQEEWTGLESRQTDLNPAALYLRLQQLGMQDVPDALVESFKVWDTALEFYRLAQKRDQVLIENSIQFAQNHKAKVLVLISGGFHNTGFEKALRSQKISFAFVRPVIRKAVGAEQYHNVMLGKNAKFFGDGRFEIASKQVALLLKELFEVGSSILRDTYQIEDKAIGNLLMKAIQSHPLLNAEVRVEPAKVRKEGEFLIFLPAVKPTNSVVNALADEALTQRPSAYYSLGSSSDGSVHFDARIGVGRNGTLSFEGFKRSELRTGEHPLSPEEKWKHLNLRSEEDYFKYMKAMLGLMTVQELLKEAFHQEGIDIAPVSHFAVPVPGLLALEKAVGRLPSETNPAVREDRKEVLRGILKRAIPIDFDELALDEEAGAQLLREDKHALVEMSGGMSVRGGVYANEWIYIPRYGKVPLLGLKILSALHAAQKSGASRLPRIRIAQSDFTVPRVQRALEWLVNIGVIKTKEEMNLFLVSIVPRLRENGDYYRPDDKLQGFASASHHDAVRYYVYSGQFGDDLVAGVKAASFMNMNIPTATVNPRIIGHLYRLAEEAKAYNEAHPGQELPVPAVLMEFTDNRGEQGGFLARVTYHLETGIRTIDQSIESWLLRKSLLERTKEQKSNYPVFNTNTVHILLEYIHEFYDLDNLGFTPTSEALWGKHSQAERNRTRLLNKLDEATSKFGNADPGQKIATYPEVKTILNPDTGKPEPVVQIGRLLSDFFATASYAEGKQPETPFSQDMNGRAIAYYVPRETVILTNKDDPRIKEPIVVPSRYDSAKTQYDIVAHMIDFGRALYDPKRNTVQLLKLPESVRPLPEADKLMAGTVRRIYLEEFKNLSQSVKNKRDQNKNLRDEYDTLLEQFNRSGSSHLARLLANSSRAIELSKVELSQIEGELDALSRLYFYTIDKLNVRDADQIRKLGKVWRTFRRKVVIGAKAAFVDEVTSNGGPLREPPSLGRSELRIITNRPELSEFIAPPDRSTPTQKAQLAEHLANRSAKALPPAVVQVTQANFHGIFGGTGAESVARELIGGSEFQTPPTPLTGEESNALGLNFIERFFPVPARSVQVTIDRQVVLAEQFDGLPKVDHNFKLWIRYMATHPNLSWSLDVDGINNETAKTFLTELLAKAKEWGLPLRPGQIAIHGSAVAGFDAASIRQPIAAGRRSYGYIANEIGYLKAVPLRKDVIFRRAKSRQTLADRLIAGEAALLGTIPEDLRLNVGPVSDLANLSGLNINYDSLVQAIQAYEALAVAA